jgi:hypothetical protein
MSIITAPAVLSTPADDWSDRFDAAQARYRDSHRKPAAAPVVEAPAGPVPFTGDPDDPAFLHDPAFYQKFIRTPELVKARLDAVAANLARVDAQLDAVPASLAEELAAAVARDDWEIPADGPADFSTDPMWEERWTVEAPARPTPADLLKPITLYPLNHPTRRANADDLAAAHEVGYQLGTDGFTIRDVAPPAFMTAAECDHFMAGLEAGEARLWADFAADMEEMADREATMDALFGDPYREVNEMELAEAGSALGHMA